MCGFILLCKFRHGRSSCCSVYVSMQHNLHTGSNIWIFVHTNLCDDILSVNETLSRGKTLIKKVDIIFSSFKIFDTGLSFLCKQEWWIFLYEGPNMWICLQTPILWSHGLSDRTVLFEAGQAGPPFLEKAEMSCEFKVLLNCPHALLNFRIPLQRKAKTKHQTYGGYLYDPFRLILVLVIQSVVRSCII